MNQLQFKEIEHKFVVTGDGFDPDVFRSALEALGPTEHKTLRVRDRYFITEAGRERGFVIRHRCDRELHQLTLKAVAQDAEVRDEINVELREGDQEAQVDAFVRAMGVVWQGALWKDLEVWQFADCEVVYYAATTDSGAVRCVEFEATSKPSLEAALAIVQRYEAATGFAAATRTPASVVELLWPDVMADLRMVGRRKMDA